jgi:hypothetical protein
VAPGHAPIPANTVVNIGNVQQLSGFTPDQFLQAADAAVANFAGTDTGDFPTVPANYWTWDPFGNLTTIVGINGTAGLVPITVDPNFKVPYTRNYHAGIQHGIGSDMVLTFDYYHKDIVNILTVRATNLAFEARMPGHGNELVGPNPKRIESFGPWGAGTYDGFTIGFQKRMSKHFTIQTNYTFTHAVDDVLNSNLTSDIQSGQGVNFLAIAGLTDSFVGTVPLVTDQNTGQTNANGAFVNSNRNPVPKAGTFYNGAIVDKGPSDLSLNHTFLTHGIVQLPWTIELSGIFRAQSGFHFTRGPNGGPDFDGDGLFNGEGLNFAAGTGQNIPGVGPQYARNINTAPAFVNMDMRVAKRFRIGERVKAQVLFEFFNLFNKGNTAALQGLEGVTPAFGATTQYLPGREGQFGLRLEF